MLPCYEFGRNLGAPKFQDFRWLSIQMSVIGAVLVGWVARLIRNARYPGDRVLLVIVHNRGVGDHVCLKWSSRRAYRQYLTGDLPRKDVPPRSVP